MHSPQHTSSNRKFLYSKNYNYQPYPLVASNGERSASFDLSYSTHLASFNNLKLSQRANSTPDISSDVPFFVHANIENTEKIVTKQNESSSRKPVVVGRKKSRRKRTAPKPPDDCQVSALECGEQTDCRSKESKGNSSRSTIGNLLFKSKDLLSSWRNEDSELEDTVSVCSAQFEAQPVSSDDSLSATSSSRNTVD